MRTPEEFDEIRPYDPEELPAIFEELIADPEFRAAAEQVRLLSTTFPNVISVNGREKLPMS